jgi:asparagine synthase (glutamine-hydrolysing)
MQAVVAHRGPDDTGSYIDNNVCLGHQRLSIIDLAGGHQPLSNEDDTIWLVYNGEIYNYKSLTAELERRGHKFKTASDTEVIVHLYEDLGTNAVTKLNGMFAFAIWDANKQLLFLARDRLGIKPLYYTVIDDIFMFASEIKSILQFDAVRREVNLEALHYYLAFRSSPLPETMFRNIMKLLPGHLLTYKSGTLRIRKYWDINMSVQSRDWSIQNYADKLREILMDAVEQRLMSEVPLGVYLSGGIDSGSVVGLMSTMVSEPVKTFSVGFGIDEQADELSHAALVADYFGADHHEIIVKPNTIQLLPRIVWHADEPLGDPTTIPTYLLSEHAKKKVTVVLTGEGGDEQFAGYDQYKIMSFRTHLGRKLPRKLSTALLPALARVAPKSVLDSIFKYSSRLGEEGIKRFSEFLEVQDDVGKCYLTLISIFSEREKYELYTERTKTYLKRRADEFNTFNQRFFNNLEVSHVLNQLLLFDSKILLPEDLLMKVDKMTMAHAIEARVPFLDHRLVEFSASIPPELKLRRLTDKYILRKAMEKLLPSIITKRKKEFFHVPISSWFDGELKAVTTQILSEASVKRRAYFNYERILTMFDRYTSSRLYYARQLWLLLIFEIWYRLFIEGDYLSAPPSSIDAII